jgi:hypothetical protein
MNPLIILQSPAAFEATNNSEFRIRERVWNPDTGLGLNVMSIEILYGNVLIFDFCCISRCSGENSPGGGFSLQTL